MQIFFVSNVKIIHEGIHQKCRIKISTEAEALTDFVIFNFGILVQMNEIKVDFIFNGLSLLWIVLFDLKSWFKSKLANILTILEHATTNFVIKLQSLFQL